MSRLRSFSVRQLIVAAELCVVVATSSLVPLRLIAQNVAPSADIIEKASPDQLSGRIYVRAGIEVKTDDGSTAKHLEAIIAVNPNNGSWEELRGVVGWGLRASPDGARAAFAQFQTPMDNKSNERTSDLLMTTLDDIQLVKIADKASNAVWSPDGGRLLYNIATIGRGERRNGVSLTFDLATNRIRKLPIPETDEVDDWSSKGDWLVTVSDRHPPFGSGYQLYVMHPDGTDERRLTEGPGLNCYPRFRPGGKQVIYLHQQKGVNSLWTVDVDGSHRAQIVTADNGVGMCDHACWSPDGQWLAVERFDWLSELDDQGNRRRGSERQANPRIEVIASDASNRRVVKLEGVTHVRFLELQDWR